MKPLGKTSDGVMDNLLRAYVSRSANPTQICPEFDPDLANAYIEHSLPSGVRARYEHHLSECGACRKSVVALAKMSDIPASVSPVRDRAPWLSGVRRVLGAMSRPQWAMATAAVLVLAISLPVILTRDLGSRREKAASSVATDSAPVASPEALRQADQVREGFDADSKNAPADSSPSTAAQKRRESETGAAGSEANSRTPQASGVVASVTDQKNSSSAAEAAQKKSVDELAAQAPAQVAGSASTVAKSDSEESRSKQRTEKDAAQPAPEPKPGRVDEPRDKEKVAKAEEVAQPPAAPPSSDADRARGGLRRPSKLALRDSAGSGESVRSNERKINKKDFFFRDNAWTDKDYDPSKDLPVVTIIRDSNVYKELLAKRAGLRPYLESFGENQRAIIVFKGTVYKLIPQK